MKYKLRAEIQSDIYDFIQLIYNDNLFKSLKIEWSGIPLDDFTLEFETLLSINEIISILKKLEDSHVMYQSLKPIELYDGERNFDIE